MQTGWPHLMSVTSCLCYAPAVAICSALIGLDGSNATKQFFHLWPNKNVQNAKNHRTRTLTQTFGNNRTFNIFAERSAYSPNTGYIF